ncbi:MAG TPA: DMT family transporter [Candidatus Acidoferrales bacterium]|nr:DMT family transporter [Candidatus Acidoferrales bacterium]
MRFSQKTKTVLAYTVCTLVWGTTWFSIRLTIAPGGYPTYEAAALRFSIAVVVIALCVPHELARVRERVGTAFPWLCTAGLMNSASYALLYKGEENVPGSVAAVIYGALPLLTALGAAATRSERISAGQVGGGVVALGGIAMLFWDRLHVSREQAVGVGLVIGAVLANAAYLLLYKRKVHAEPSVATTGVFLAATTAGLWTSSLALGSRGIPWPPPVKATMALVYLGLAGTVLTFVCYLYLIRHVGVATSSTLIIAESVLALGVDRMWERQGKLAALSYLGAAVALAGSAVSIVLRPEETPPS